MNDVNSLRGKLVIKMHISLEPNRRGKDITLHSVHCTRGECQEHMDKFLALNPELIREIGAEFIHVDHIY